MENINTIVFAIFAVFGLIGALIGFSKGLIRSAIKVLTILLAIVAALSLTPVVITKAELVLPDDILAPIEELFVASPTLNEYLPILTKALVSPIVFIVVFVACLIVASIVCAIVNAIIKAILPKKKGLVGRLGGLALGLVGGVLIALCFVFPIAGYCNYVPTIYTNVSGIISTEENPIDPNLEEAIINLPNLSAIKTVNGVTSEQFKKLTSSKDGETDVSSLEVLTTITSIVPPTMRFVNSVGSLSAMDSQSVRDIGAILEENDQLRVITAEIVKYACQKWLNNEAFMGINLKDKFDPDAKMVLDLILDDLAVCTPDTIVADLDNIADSIDSVKSLATPAKAFVTSVGSISTLNDQAVRDVGAVLAENDEFRAMATDVINAAATKWLNNEEFMGYNLLEMMDDEYQMVLEAMLEDLATCTPDNIVEVLNKIANTIQTVREVFG